MIAFGMRFARRIILRLCCLAFVTAPAVMSVQSAPPQPDPLVARLQAKLDALESLKGRFTQSLESATLGRPRIENGSFALRKPGRMRWEYQEPEKKLAISNGGITWFYLPEEREAYKGSVSAAREGGPAVLLLSGGLRLDRDFSSRRLTADEAGPQGFAGAEAVELKPLRPSEEFERVILGVDTHRALIRRL
ncbi:MAG TPA: outer membrane lipoprotein carrier protein LolA, partial [Candidatus Polarisedimenticolia bacterium]|nr:outer membrane lipoprotein carrier protein LolA [Candidatus Polarisedimenticolia bacterium]